MRKYDLVLELFDSSCQWCKIWADQDVLDKIEQEPGVAKVSGGMCGEADVYFDPRYDKTDTIEAICQLAERSIVVSDVSELEEAS